MKMKSPSNRIRQARLKAALSQQSLANLVGVHRSAVAQWERKDGAIPTADHMARIALATSVQFEWLATARGRMKFGSDLGSDEGGAALLYEYCAHDEMEGRALAALRKLNYKEVGAFVEMLESLAKIRSPALKRALPHSR